MTHLTIPIAQLQLFMFLFLRVGAILLTAPLFDSRNIPVMVKAGLTVAISLLLFPLFNPAELNWPTGILPFVIGVIGEILVGVIIGYSIKLFFTGIQLAGQLAGFQMGFAIANVMDPMATGQIPLLAQFYNLVAMLVFMSVNAHHFFLKAVADSFRIVRPFHFRFSEDLLNQIVTYGGNMFIIALQVGAPVIAVMLLTSVVMGILARTVPQMHILIVAMPLKIVVGLIFIALTLPFLIVFLKDMFFSFGQEIFTLLRLF